jgi:hypothetical protein
MTFFVYGLFDSGDWSECRYVGATSRVERPLEHLRTARRGRNYREKWISSVLREGRHVGWKILGAHDTWEDTLAAERWAILGFRVSGHRLTNATEGGEGVVPTAEVIERRKEICARPEVKARQREGMAKTNALPETRIRRSTSQREVQNRPEVKEKNRASTAAAWCRVGVKERHSLAMRTAHTRPEFKAKVSPSSKARWEDPILRSRMLRKAA